MKEHILGIHASTDPSIRAKYEVLRLRESHHEMINLHVLGHKNIDLARIFNYSEQQVSHILCSELAQVKIRELRAARDSGTVHIQQELENLGPMAVVAIEDVLSGASGGSPADKLRASFGLLGLIGHVPVTKHHVTQDFELHLTPKDISEIKDRARKAGVLPPREDPILDVKNEAKEISYEEVPSSIPGTTPDNDGSNGSGTV